MGRPRARARPRALAGTLLALSLLMGLAPAAWGLGNEDNPMFNPREELGAKLRMEMTEALEPAQPQEAFHITIPGGVGGHPCYQCHFQGMGSILPEEELPRKYSISSAFASYLESPHGRLRELGERNAPMCEDCHLTREWTDILPQEHPESPINPDNLAQRCAKCHGKLMLTDNVVMNGSMHLELQKRSLLPGEPLEVRYGFLPGITKLERSYYVGGIDVIAWINFGFMGLALVVLTSMSLYVVLDLVRKLIERHSSREN